MSDDRALRVAARAIDGFRELVADLERQLAEAQRILALDDSRLLTAVENTARALKERDEAQGKLELVARADVGRILSKEGE